MDSITFATEWWWTCKEASKTEGRNTEIVRDCKGEIRTALLEAREAGLQAVKLSDLKMAKRSWWVWAACTQVSSHREAWMYWVGLGSWLAFIFGHLKPMSCSSDSLPRGTLLPFFLCSVQHIIWTHMHKHKSTNLHSVGYTAIRLGDNMIYI